MYSFLFPGDIKFLSQFELRITMYFFLILNLTSQIEKVKVSIIVPKSSEGQVDIRNKSYFTSLLDFNCYSNSAYAIFKTYLTVQNAIPLIIIL